MGHLLFSELDKDAKQKMLDELSIEMALLVSKKAKHQDHLHETEAGKLDAEKADSGGMAFCPGCRLITISKAIPELLEELT